jgi:hypothetical protein
MCDRQKDAPRGFDIPRLLIQIQQPRILGNAEQ